MGQSPRASDLLALWERGLGKRVPEQALVLLAAAFPAGSTESLSALPIGQRDAALLALRRRLFGSQLAAVAACPQCGDQLELAFEADDISVPVPAQTAETPSVTSGEYEVAFRPPTTSDVIAAVVEGDVDRTRSRLLERCILSCESGGHEVPVDQIPAAVVGAAVEGMARADPQADVQLAMSCPACEHRWHQVFDIASFLWMELTSWAHRVLRQVVDLARAYGWSEADVLQMSPLRRALYLELAG